MKGKKMLQLRVMMASVIIFVFILSIIAVNTTKENELMQTVMQVQQHPQEAIVEEQPKTLYTCEEMYAVAKVLSGERYDDELDDKRNVVRVICNRVTDGRLVMASLVSLLS